MSLLVIAKESLLYLGFGIFSDILISAYTIFVAEDLLYPAGIASTSVSFLNLLLIVKYFVVTPSIINIASYAIGTGIGTIALMKLRRLYKKWREKNEKNRRIYSS
jgi:uncharacterized protein YebE (UPF0316 family)